MGWVGWFWLGFIRFFPWGLTDWKNDNHCATDLANIKHATGPNHYWD